MGRLGVFLATAAGVTCAAAYSETTAKTVFKLASSAYCNDAGLADWACRPCASSELLARSVSVYQNSKHNMHAFTALVPGSALDGLNGSFVEDEDSPVIVISFKGTQSDSLKNWLEDLKFARTSHGMSCVGCAVHSGFTELWAAVATPLVADVRHLLVAHPGARIVVTGHSMGGAVALVAAYVLQHDLGIHVSGPIYTYGSPRVGNAAFAEQFSPERAASWADASPPTVWRLTHNRDPVPHLPLEAMGFVHAGYEVFYDEAWAQHTVCDGRQEDPNCADSHWLWNSVDDHLYYFAEEVGVCK